MIHDAKGRAGVALSGVLLLGGASAQSFTSAKYGFSITPPRGWQRGSVPGFAAEYFFSPRVVNGGRPNINVLEPIDTRGVSPREVCDANAQGVKQALESVSSVRSTFDAAANSCRLTYRATVNGASLFFYQDLRFSKGRYHTITFTAPNGAYQQLLPTVQAAIKTFRAR